MLEWRVEHRCDSRHCECLSEGTGTLNHVETPYRSSAVTPESHLAGSNNVYIDLVPRHHTPLRHVRPPTGRTCRRRPQET